MSDYISDENDHNQSMNKKAYKSREYLSDDEKTSKYNNSSSQNYLRAQNGTRNTSMNNPDRVYKPRSLVSNSQERLPEMGKTIRLLRNGDPFYRGHKFVISTRRYRYFDVFMDDISDTLNANFGAIRKIYTVDGQVLDNLDTFEDGLIYVAAGTEKFIRLNYTEISEGKRQPPHRLPSLSTGNYPSFNVTQYDPNNSIVINVFRNGDAVTSAHKILLYKNSMVSLEAILNEISSKVKLKNGPILQIYKMNGESVYTPNELENGFSYVAASREKFKNVDYTVVQEAVKTSVHRQASRELPPVKKQANHNNQSTNQIKSHYKTKVVFDNKNEDIFNMQNSSNIKGKDENGSSSTLKSQHQDNESSRNHESVNESRESRLQEKSFREKEDEELQHNYQNIVDDEYSDVNSTSFSEIKSE